jgi:predicted ATP-dependent serine protease
MMKEKNNPPCHNCTDRHAGCHGKCEKYQTWNADHIERNRQERTAKERENMMRAYYVETCHRNQKSRDHKSRGKAQ